MESNTSTAAFRKIRKRPTSLLRPKTAQRLPRRHLRPRSRTPSRPRSSTESHSLSPAEEAYEIFEASEYEDQQALVEEIIGDPDQMDAENAFHMINDLVPIAIDRGEADWALHVIFRLENEQPDTYAAELPYLPMNHLEAAAATGRVEEVVAKRADTLETMATDDIDQFYPCIELVAYHGSLAPIAAAMSNALEAVRSSSDIMPHGKDGFCNQTIQYTVLAQYEQHDVPKPPPPPPERCGVAGQFPLRSHPGARRGDRLEVGRGPPYSAATSITTGR